MREELQIAERSNNQPKDSTGKHVLPVVPVVCDPRHADHRSEEQRQDHDAELGNVSAPVKHPDLAGKVPRQEAQPGKGPCIPYQMYTRKLSDRTGFFFFCQGGSDLER